MKKLNHANCLEDMVQRPHLIGIQNVIWSAKEMNFFHGHDLYCQPDIIFFNGQYYAIEYKSTDNAFAKAKDQLARASYCIQEYFNKKPIKLFVWGKSPQYGISRVN